MSSGTWWRMMDRLIKGLDGFLERDQDRALFGLPLRPTSDHESPAGGTVSRTVFAASRAQGIARCHVQCR